MSPTPERTLLAIEDLKVRFAGPQGATQVVRGVDLSLEAGEVLALVGESGSGKSVTSLAVMGLLGPSAEVQGHVRFQDRSGVVQDLTTMSPKGRAGLRGAQMAMIFQEPMTALNPVLSVGAQIGEVMRLHEGLRGGPLRRRVIELLRSVDIADPDRRADAYPHELSGGMRQRVMIAMALACRPSLLIADEPTTALDVTVQMQILDLLRRAQSDLGMGVLFITHNLALVAAIADRVAVMYAGRVVETAPVRTLFSRPRHPYTQGLLASLPERRGVGPKRRLRAISGSPPDPREPEVGCAFAPRCPLAVEPCRREPPSLEPVATVGASRCLRWREL